MPVSKALRPLYGPDWREVSQRIRFDRAQGRCEGCGRAHGAILLVLPTGARIDLSPHQPRLPGLLKPRPAPLRRLRIILTTAHLDHDPTNGADDNLAAWCQRCHLEYDLQHHLETRRQTIEARRQTHRAGLAVADLFDR